MIMRRWTTSIIEARGAEYERFAEEISLPMFQQFDGLLAVFMSRSATAATVNTLWRDREAITLAEASPLYVQTVAQILSASVLEGQQNTILEDVHLIWPPLAEMLIEGHSISGQ